MLKKDIWKKILVAIIFFLVMGLTFYAVFSGTDPRDVFKEMLNIAPLFVVAMLLSAVAFVATEGLKIWLMMDGRHHFKYYFRCCCYALVELFYGGITPSASGGQPIQLLYMKRDGYSFSRGCASMSFIEATNKGVLAFSGLLIVIFWRKPLFEIFDDYIGWYFLGWGILIFWTCVLIMLIIKPEICERAVLFIMKLPIKMRLIKDSKKANDMVVHFFDGYRHIFAMIKESKLKAVLVAALSFLQRFFLLLVTYWVYLGLGLSGTGFWEIIIVQLIVVVASDMIPLPGAQGISEFIYHKIFVGIFGTAYLTTSMCAMRAVSFYFILFLGILVVIGRKIPFKKKNKVISK